MSLEVRKPRPSQETRPAETTATDTQSTTGSRLGDAAADWRRDAAAILDTLARTGQPFTADDVLMLVGAPPTTGRQISSAFGLAQWRHLIVPVGATVGHGGRLLRVWRGVPT
jgi:hypothetical protein